MKFLILNLCAVFLVIHPAYAGKGKKAAQAKSFATQTQPPQSTQSAFSLSQSSQDEAGVVSLETLDIVAAIDLLKDKSKWKSLREYLRKAAIESGKGQTEIKKQEHIDSAKTVIDNFETNFQSFMELIIDRSSQSHAARIKLRKKEKLTIATDILTSFTLLNQLMSNAGNLQYPSLNFTSGDITLIEGRKNLYENEIKPNLDFFSKDY